MKKNRKKRRKQSKRPGRTKNQTKSAPSKNPQKKSSELEFVSPFYMKDFRCICEKCENTCCFGWALYVDRDSYGSLIAAMGPDRLEEAQKIYTKRADPGEQGERYALVTLEKDGYCSQFRDGLCRLHGEFGEHVLSDTCSMFPRKVTRIGNRVEVSSTVACPEAARGILLLPNAMELVDFDRSRLPRQRGELVNLSGLEPWEARYDDLRSGVLELLGVKGVPWSLRAIFVALLADRLTGKFGPGIKEDWVDQVWQEVANEATLASYAEEISQLEIGVEHGLQIAHTLFQLRLQQWVRPKFRALLEKCYKNIDSSPELPLNLEQVSGIYESRRQKLVQRYEERLDLYFSNFSTNFWFTKKYTDSPGLMTHVRLMLTTTLLIKFLMICHPGIDELLETEPSEDGFILLDSLVVEVVHLLARDFDHAIKYHEHSETVLNNLNIHSLANMIHLARF